MNLEALKDELEEAQDYLVKARNSLREAFFIANNLGLEEISGMLKENLIPDVEVLIDDEHIYITQNVSVQQVLDALNDIEEEELEEELEEE